MSEGTARIPRAAVRVGDGVHLDASAIIGCPKEARIVASRRGEPCEPEPVRIGAGSIVMAAAVIHEGAEIGVECVVEDQVRIGYDTRIGDRSRLMYRAYICDRVDIGADCRVAGFVCDATVIGDRCSILGQLGHEYSQPHRGWWAVDEPSPRVEDDSVIGLGAVVVGDVRIGPRSYVAAGAVVTRDVPPEHVAVGVNELVPAREWPGPRLRGLIEHWAGRDS